jgi:PhnB protein
MAKQAKAIPEGYHSVTPFLNLKNAIEAAEFIKKAFGAEERSRFQDPQGQLMHCELKIGDSLLIVSEALRDTPMPGGIQLYVKDCDKVWGQAVTAGATVVIPLADQFWGDRWGTLQDPFGNRWSIGTHKEDVPPAEMQKRAAAAMQKQA